MKKELCAVMLSAAMAASLAACGGSSAPATTAAPAATEAKADAPAESGEAGGLTGTFNLGMIGPLTGGAAIYGNSVHNAAQIAVDEINETSGAFQFAYNGQDDEHDAEKSVNAYHNLQDWGVDAIVGCVTTTPCVAVGAEANGDRVFMLTPSASSTSVTEGKDNVYQLCFSDPNQGSASAQYIKDNNLAEKVAVIYNNSDAYSTGIYQKFQEAADSLGLEIVSVTTFTDDTANDFSVQLTEAQNAEADLLFLPIYYTPASLILQQAASTGFDATVFGVDGMDGILTLEGFKTELAEGVMLLTPFSADATDDKTVNFVTKYEAKCNGEVPSQFAADAYDCVYAIYSALEYYAEKNGGLNVEEKSTEEICDILTSVFSDSAFSVDGITGEGMTWVNCEVNKAPKAVVIKDGAYVGL